MLLALLVTVTILTSGQCYPTIHLVPHSHCDAGYRLSFEEYYEENVHLILDTLLVALSENTERKFVWEEVSFLSRWWQDASLTQKETMKKLMSEKRLEFIGGGWVMHDEAVTSSFTILTQMTLGLQYLNNTLHTRPQYEWHIDPFGHSLVMSELYSALQYKAIVLNRIPDSIKQKMRENKSLEFYWKSPYSNTTIFTHVLGEHYSTPVMIGFDTVEKAESLVQTIKKRLQWSRTDHLLVPFGNDFAFVNASLDFQKMEKVVNYINSQHDKFGLIVQFSTLDDYFSNVMSSKTDFPVVDGGDFFPYIACYPCLSEKCGGLEGGIPCSYGLDDAYWSGFYTSKPSQKLLAREQEAETFSLFALSTLVNYDNNDIVEDSLKLSRNTTSLLAHHDAITGTSFPSCYDDYNKRLNTAMTNGKQTQAILKEVALCGHQLSLLSPDVTSTLNHLTDSNIAVAVFFNPSGQTRAMYSVIEMPFGLCLEVLSKDLTVLSSQRVGTKLYIPVEIGPFELKVMYLKKTDCSIENVNHFVQNEKVTNLNNGFIELAFDDNNQFVTWTSHQRNELTKMTLNFTRYLEKESTKLPHSVCDGSNVYTFIPDDGSQNLIMTNKLIPTVQTASGPLVWEIEQQITTDVCPINVTLRLFKPIGDNDLYKDFIEIQPKIGPLSNSRPNSISLRLQTDLESGDYFKTYTNGIYPMLRTYNKDAPFQGNFYPLVGRASIVDEAQKKGLVLATKRPMGITSTHGMIEVLSHRRINLFYDPRGNDDSIVDDTIMLGMTNEVNNVSWNAMEQSQLPFSVHIGIVDHMEMWTSACNDSWKPFIKSLPQNVHLVSMELLKGLSDGNILVGMRFINEQPNSIDINIGSLLAANWSVKEINQTTPDFQITTQEMTTSHQVTLLPMKLASYSLLISTTKQA